MKKTQIAELFANLAATIVSFFSIVMFVALGVGVFLGLRWSSAALTTTVQGICERQAAPDIEISYPYGLDSEDIAAIREVEGVEDVECGYVTFAETSINGIANSLRIQSLTESIGVPEALEGRLPVAAGEIAVLDVWAKRAGVSVGDVLTLDEGDAIPFLATTTVTVVGTVESSDFLAHDSSTYGVSTTGSGGVDGVAFTSKESFNELFYLGGWPCAYIRIEGSSGAASADMSRDVAGRLEEMSVNRAAKRYGSIRELLEYMVAGGRSILVNYPMIVEAFELDAQMIDEMLGKAEVYLGSMRDTGWIVLSRQGNGGLLFVDTFEQILGRLCWSMASLFLVVGFLVCYSAIARIVYEQVVQIGTKKALGLYRPEIYRSYLWYSGLAVVSGTIIGALAAVFIVQTILNPSLSSAFSFGSYPAYFSLPDTLCAGLGELALILLATWLSCRGALQRRAVDLLQGAQDHGGRHLFFEGWRSWKRLPLLVQTMVLNCLNDTRRLVATLVGVAGCTALVVSALVLQNDVLESFRTQFRDEFAFEMIVTPRDNNIAGATQALSDIGSKSAPVLRRSSTISSRPGEVAFGALIVPTDQASFFELYRMHATDDAPIDLSQFGVWVTAGYADKTHAKVGDVVSVRGPSGIVRKVPIVGFYTYYLVGVEMVMGPLTYQRLYGELPKANVLLATSDGDELAADFLAKVDHTGTVLTVTNHKSRSSRVFQAFQKISDTVVKLYVALATLMAIVVLLNLDTMFVEEKRRELTVLMILGFSVRDAKAYVRNDTVALTIVGIIIGVFVGTGFGILAVMSVEPMNTVFLRQPNIPAALIGAAVSALLSAIMGYLAFRRIPKFKLADINRI